MLQRIVRVASWAGSSKLELKIKFAIELTGHWVRSPIPSMSFSENSSGYEVVSSS